MKYLAILLIIISISAQSLNVHSTVIHVQSSKGKHIKASKAEQVKKVSNCPVNQGKLMKRVESTARIGNVKAYKP